MEHWLQDTTYQQQVWWLLGFAACVHLGRYGQGKQVAIGTVSGELSDVGTTVDLAYEGNPTKVQVEKSLVPILAQMMEGWRKEDSPTKIKMTVGIDVPEFLVELGMETYATEMVKVVGDWEVIAFYYLLRLGEYTMKKQRNETKQMVQFKLEDTIVFRYDARGHLQQLPINALEEDIFLQTEQI